MKIFSGIGTKSIRTIQNQQLNAAKHVHQTTKDVFEKSTSVKDIAVQFRDTVLRPFTDFDVVGVIPKDAEKGSGYLKGILTPFSEAIEKFNSHEAEKFVKLSMGTAHLPVLEHGAKVNSDISHFVKTLEAKAGKALKDIIK